MRRVENVADFFAALGPGFELQPWQLRIAEHVLRVEHPVVIPAPRFRAQDVPRFCSGCGYQILTLDRKCAECGTTQ